MKTLSLLLNVAFFLFLSNSVFSQISIDYDKNYTFKKLEISEASVSKKGLSIGFSEFNTNNGQEQDGVKLPPYFQLILDVNAIKEIKFPIQPNDSIFFTETKLQQDLKINLKQNEFIKELEKKGIKKQIETFNERKKTKQQRIEELSKKLAKGDMSVMKELQKLSNELTQEAISLTEKTVYEEETQPSNFDLIFIDTNEFLEHKLLYGYLHIKEFTKNKFVAEFSGEFISECLEQHPNCKKTPSKSIPQLKVAKEGKVKGSININLKDFYDNR